MVATCPGRAHVPQHEAVWVKEEALSDLSSKW